MCKIQGEICKIQLIVEAATELYMHYCFTFTSFKHCEWATLNDSTWSRGMCLTGQLDTTPFHTCPKMENALSQHDDYRRHAISGPIMFTSVHIALLIPHKMWQSLTNRNMIEFYRYINVCHHRVSTWLERIPVPIMLWHFPLMLSTERNAVVLRHTSWLAWTRPYADQGEQNWFCMDSSSTGNLLNSTNSCGNY